MTPAFNLLDEPWIPVRTHSGEVFDINLSDALLKARDYAALAETSPPNLIALYRLLLAMLHRALTTHHGKWSDKDRARWFREGLPEEPIRAYLTEWRERFWLFHPTEPFMQVAALATEVRTKDKLKPWSQLALELAGGDTPLVFDHSHDSDPEPASFARVLRCLVGYLQFAPGGLVKTFKTSDCAGPLASTAAVLPFGFSLLETLLLPLHPWSRDAVDDIPSWEQSSPSLANILAAPTLATGNNDRYTRLTRSVLLVPDIESKVICFVRFGEGCALQDDNTDPMVSCRVEDGEAKRVSFTDGRSIWRDLPSMVPDAMRTYDIPAASLAWATNLNDALGDRGELRIVIGGWKNAPRRAAKVVRWRLERLDLPMEICTQPDAATFLRTQVRFSEQVHEGVKVALESLVVQTMPDPKHKDTRSRARKILTNSPAAAVFFSTAERALPRLMLQITDGEFDAADRDWKTMLIEAANGAWTATRSSLGDSPAVLRADARTWPRFRSVLKTLIPLAAQAASTTEEVAA